MTLTNFENMVLNSSYATEGQKSFVQTLQEDLDAGNTTTKVFSNNTWTTVNLKSFIKLQADKLQTMQACDKDLQNLLDSLTKTLDESLPKILPPEERDPEPVEESL